MLTEGRRRRSPGRGRPVSILLALFAAGVAVIAVWFGLLREGAGEPVARATADRPAEPLVERGATPDLDGGLATEVDGETSPDAGGGPVADVEGEVAPDIEGEPTPEIQSPPVQEAVGPLPEPPGAARVDLSRPSLLGDLKLSPAPVAGLAFDFADGSVLWRRGATRVRPIASLTKLMTGLLAVESFGPRSRVLLTAEPDQIGGTHMGGLRAGRGVRAEELLKGLMISSGNDAAVALAIGGAGSVPAWVARMNRRAELLGLTCTHFVDPHGLDERNRSCPADIAALAIRAMNEPRLARIARRPLARVWPGFGPKRTLRTTNHLLRERYPGAIGLKTGYTSRAGHCLVAVIERGERRIGIVLLGSGTDAFDDARKIARAAARAGAIDAAT